MPHARKEENGILGFTRVVYYNYTDEKPQYHTALSYTKQNQNLIDLRPDSLLYPKQWLHLETFYRMWIKKKNAAKDRSFFGKQRQ